VSYIFHPYLKIDQTFIFFLLTETSVFAYLGLGIFSFPHRLEPALVIWSIVLCLFGKHERHKKQTNYVF